MMFQISHRVAMQTLQEVIPGCPNLNPDDISLYANRSGARQTIKEYKDWMQVADETLWNELASGTIDLRERITVVADASFSRAYGPFELDGIEIEDFVGSHLSVCGESLFNGDVVLVRPDAGRVDIFHHEGIFIHITTRLADC